MTALFFRDGRGLACLSVLKRGKKEASKEEKKQQKTGRPHSGRVATAIPPTVLPDDTGALEPPDPIPNSDVKRCIADGSVGCPHVRVGHRQAFIQNPPGSTGSGGGFVWREEFGSPVALLMANPAPGAPFPRFQQQHSCVFHLPVLALKSPFVAAFVISCITWINFWGDLFYTQICACICRSAVLHIWLAHASVVATERFEVGLIKKKLIRWQ